MRGLSRDAGRRISRVVQDAEARGIGSGIGIRRGSAVPARPELWSVISVDLVAKTCVVKRIAQDGTPNDISERTVRILSGNILVVGDVVLLTRSTDGEMVAFSGGGNPGYDGTALGSTSESEAALTDSWTRATGPVGLTLALTWIWRQGYDETGTQVIYVYYRTTTYDRVGIYSVSVETRVLIDVPVYGDSL